MKNELDRDQRTLHRLLHEDALTSGQILLLLSERKNPHDMQLEGFALDTTTYPWFAYKGDRFAPDIAFTCLTALEAAVHRPIPDVRHLPIGMKLIVKGFRHNVEISSGYGPNPNGYSVYLGVSGECFTSQDVLGIALDQ